MPFQSEKQRRYLWANEPEIARDWADTYGSRIEKNDGGISQLVKSGPGRPGYNGQGDKGTYGQAGQSYGDRQTSDKSPEVGDKGGGYQDSGYEARRRARAKDPFHGTIHG